MENELNERERQALAGLPTEVEPQPELREKIVRELRGAGLLRRGRHVMALAVAAALIAGFAAGLLAHRPTPPVAHEREFMLFVHDTPGMRTDGAEALRVGEYRRWAQQLRSRGTLTDGQKLTDDVTTVGSSPGNSTLGGYFRIVARDRAEAEAVARSCPHIRYGGWIEVREIDHG